MFDNIDRLRDSSDDRVVRVPHFDSKAIIEKDLAASGLPYTITAPTYFFDNALGGADRIAAGILDLPLPPDRPLQQLARPDLGAFVAKVLLDPKPYLGRRIELASDAVTPAQMAEALSVAEGRPVRHQQTPLESIRNPDMHAMWRSWSISRPLPVLFEPGRFGQMRTLPWLPWSSSRPCGRVYS